MNNMTDKKQWGILFLVGLILVFVIYNQVSDNNEMHEHHDFFQYMTDNTKQMQEFMSRGGRNTSSMGEYLCEHVNELKAANDQESINCKEIYQ